MAKNRTKKIIVAGSLVVEAVYDRITVKDGPTARASKHKASSEAQRRMNRIYSVQKLELLLAANFRPGDIVLTLTYDDEHLPADRKGAEAALKAFRRRVTVERVMRGQELRMIWNIEHKHGEGRWHHHAVLNSTGEDFEQLHRLWPCGILEAKKLIIDRDHSYEALARYMAKEEGDKLGQRSWSCTRNLRKPEVETFRVEDDTTVQVPKGGVTLKAESGRDAWTGWQVVKYLAPGWDRHDRPKAKRRRRRR